MQREERPNLESEVIPAMTEILRVAQISTNPPPPPLSNNSNQSNDAPDRFICPITQDVMEDPVVASDGFTYERIAIQRWMTKTATSPMTRQRLQHRHLYTNMLLRSEMSDWKTANPSYLENT
ncbi:hypothetical protein BSKO_03873 [Bryopsis sp. KO-2023]|nr:hypothetical protein BSKO_03873 [Bryopsis sp. KO-2023]